MLLKRGIAMLLTLGLLATTAGNAFARDRVPDVLHSPFTKWVHHFDMQAPVEPKNCSMAPAPVEDLMGVGFYNDPKNSITDPTLLAKNNASLKPVRDYLIAVTQMVDKAALQRDVDAGGCAISWLQTWAAGNALEGNMNDQGSLEHVWITAGLALAYLKLRDTGLVTVDAGKPIETWLATSSDSIEPQFDAARSHLGPTNLQDWAGLAIAAVGVAVNDPARFGWGMQRFREGTRQVTKDGSLPLEMRRGQRALHYHTFALDPLVMLAEIGEANGLPLYDENHGALRRLAERTLAGILDPTWFNTHAGAVQDIHGTVRIDEIAWMEPYQSRYPLPAMETLLEKNRPVIYERDGGDLTTTYAHLRGASKPTPTPMPL
jgi:poly(beta-D-mannuronate) lyase